MLPGPVFTMELLTTSRRRRYFVLRVVYLAIALLILWQAYSDSFRHPGSSLAPIRDMSQFAQTSFWSFITLQSITLALLTPVFLSGVICDEKQRKTLHYLLASQLTSGEIVIGKLASRLMHLFVFVGLGLPVMSLLTLFGGVDPVGVVLVYLATISSVLMLAGFSVLVSTLTDRVRESILITYLLVIAWLTLPPILLMVGRFWLPWIRDLLYPVLSVLITPSPMALTGIPGLGTSGFVDSYVWMVGSQMVCAIAFAGLAVLALRPVYRRSGEGARRRGLAKTLTARFPARRRPECTDDPMLWKERYVTRFRGAVRVVSVAVGGLAIALIAYGWYEVATPLVDEILTYGYWNSAFGNRASDLNQFVRFTATPVFVLTGLLVAAAAASSITSEHEEDTWITLVSTMLTSDEIVRAKLLGSLWAGRWLAGLIVLSWLAGVLFGALHPFAFVVLMVELAVYLWFVAALGLAFSLSQKNTLRALAWTIGTLIFLNAGYLLLVLLVYDDSPFVLFSSTPVMLGMSGASYSEVWWMLGLEGNSRWTWRGPLAGDETFDFQAAIVVSILGYLAAAFWLTGACVRGFDRMVDRPRRNESLVAPSVPTVVAESIGDPATASSA